MMMWACVGYTLGLDLLGRFPELVLGRISELLLPSQKRFDLPLQMPLDFFRA